MRSSIILILLLRSFVSFSQYDYSPTAKNPFGKLNPDAPKEVADYKDLIGICDCKSVKRIDRDNWADTVDMKWTYKYILNGLAVQDETLKSDGTHGGSIRQYNVDSSMWYVHFYTSSVSAPALPAWGGGMKDGEIVLYRDQLAPNGMEGFFRITFSDISKQGFNWNGAWTSKDESIIYPTWRIFCSKTEDE
ncbi:MAG: hypothetical protein ABJG78_19190 [Cyclobacteriaceae bacterium]